MQIQLLEPGYRIYSRTMDITHTHTNIHIQTHIVNLEILFNAIDLRPEQVDDSLAVFKHENLDLLSCCHQHNLL